MHWTVVAPFNRKYTNSDWLSPFVPRDRHEFLFIPRRGEELSWHMKTVPVTTRQEWIDLWHQTSQALAERKGGIITVFPQAAALIGLRKRLHLGKRFPVVAWWFNTGEYSGWKQWFAQTSLQEIDKFVVHNRCEAERYSRWLNIPEERFEFVPLQRPETPRQYEEDLENPFIFATGSGQRDYGTFFEAVKKLNVPTVVAPGRHAVEGLTVPPQAKVRFDVTRADLDRLGEQALINVIPMTTNGVTGGTVTIVEAMRKGYAIIATRRSGVEDYITDGETGLLVEPYSVEAMAEAIDRLWKDPDLRHRLGKAAYKFAAENCSDEAAGANLGRILDRVEGRVRDETSRISPPAPAEIKKSETTPVR